MSLPCPSREKLGLPWVRENTVVIHYYGRLKPWKKRYPGILDVFYRELKESGLFLNVLQSLIHNGTDMIIRQTVINRPPFPAEPHQLTLL